MTEIPDAGRQAAHVILDAVAAFDLEASEETNESAMVRAFDGIGEIEDAVVVEVEEEEDEDELSISVDVSNVVGAAVVSQRWLVEQLAAATSSTPEAVVAQLRAFLDA